MLEEFAFPPAITSFPSSGSSLCTGQCFNTQEIPWCFRRGCENLGETSFSLSPRSHAVCISLLLRPLLGPYIVNADPSPSNSAWILQRLPHSVAKNTQEEQLCDNHQEPPPTSGAASARSTELEFHHSRAITRAKCTTMSWNCSICKGEQSVNDSTAASLRNFAPQVLKK